MEEYEKAIQLDKKNPNIIFKKSNCLLKQKKF